MYRIKFVQLGPDVYFQAFTNIPCMPMTFGSVETAYHTDDLSYAVRIDNTIKALMPGVKTVIEYGG